MRGEHEARAREAGPVCGEDGCMVAQCILAIRNLADEVARLNQIVARLQPSRLNAIREASWATAGAMVTLAAATWWYLQVVR